MIDFVGRQILACCPRRSNGLTTRRPQWHPTLRALGRYGSVERRGASASVLDCCFGSTAFRKSKHWEGSFVSVILPTEGRGGCRVVALVVGGQAILKRPSDRRPSGAHEQDQQAHGVLLRPACHSRNTVSCCYYKRSIAAAVGYKYATATNPYN